MCRAAASFIRRRSRLCQCFARDYSVSSSSKERAVPLLMVFSRDHNPLSQSCRLYSLIRSSDLRTSLKFEREIDLPESATADKNLCIGSSEGFLLAIPRTINPRRISAVDPLSGTHLPLPSTATLKPISGLGPYLYRAKAILSPSRDLVILDRTYSLDFAHIAAPTSTTSRWTPLPDDYLGVTTDIIFHKGLLHVLDKDGLVGIYDLNNNPAMNWPSLIGNKRLAHEDDYVFRSSLVESPDGNDLFLLFRKIERAYWITKYFKVFKLDRSGGRGRWVKARSIGDASIFIGDSQSLSLQASHFPDILKPNSVYFTESDLVRTKFYDTGVYSLDSETIEFFEFDRAEARPPPVWFTPATALIPPTASTYIPSSHYHSS